MERDGGTKGSSGTQGRRPRAADVSVCVRPRVLVCVCWGKWECESEAGRVSPVAPPREIWRRGDLSSQPPTHTRRRRAEKTLEGRQEWFSVRNVVRPVDINGSEPL